MKNLMQYITIILALLTTIYALIYANINLFGVLIAAVMTSCIIILITTSIIQRKN
jgi:hypothetical protein